MPHHVIALLTGIICLLFMNGCMDSSNAIPSRGGPIIIRVTLQNRHDLLVELENTSKSLLTFRESNLPWMWRYSMWVKAFNDDAIGSPLDEQFMPADRPIERRVVTLLPGRSLKGSIGLRNRFPDLEEVLSRRNVIVFWNYAQEIEEYGSRTPRLYGSLIIPSNAPANKLFE